jgi:hypothetical protein
LELSPGHPEGFIFFGFLRSWEAFKIGAFSIMVCFATTPFRVESGGIYKYIYIHIYIYVYISIYIFVMGYTMWIARLIGPPRLPVERVSLWP